MAWKQPDTNIKIWIGIDCGVQTGLAVYKSGATTFTEIETTMLHRAFAKVLYYCDTYGKDRVKVVFEDARLWTHHFNTKAAKAQGAGSIKRDCKAWQDFLEDHEISFINVKPNNRITKLTKEQFFNLTKYVGISSTHGRDAGMLIYGR